MLNRRNLRGRSGVKRAGAGKVTGHRRQSVRKPPTCPAGVLREEGSRAQRRGRPRSVEGTLSGMCQQLTDVMQNSLQAHQIKKKDFIRYQRKLQKRISYKEVKITLTTDFSAVVDARIKIN